MSLTISELEAERAKILEEIESKAQSISSGKTNAGENRSLKDWLKAAEEVMPATEQTRENQSMNKAENRSNYSAQMIKTPKNKASFFGVIIMLSLLLTLLGVLYIAYTSIHKELQSILESHQLNDAKMNQLEIDMDALQKSISSGGRPELFIALEDKVFALEAQVFTLKSQLNSAQGVEEVALSESALISAGLGAEVSAHKTVTEAVLDDKLNQLEQKIDQKLQAILDHLSNGQKASSDVSAIKEVLLPTAEKNTAEQEMTISEPTIVETEAPLISQPLVKLVEVTQPPAEPKSPEKVDAPLEHYTADVKWLMAQPAVHYTLQLASMPEQRSVEKIADKKGLKEVRVIPQTRNQTTNYILLTGSFASRKDADQFAKEFKAEFGISPWVRKVKEITVRIK